MVFTQPFKLLRLAVVFLVWAGMAAADPVADRLQLAFDRWMSQYDIGWGTIAVFKDGTLVNDPDPAPVELASLSKAITAVCVMHLVDEGLLSYDSETRSVLGFGPEGLTVAQLLTHSGGLWPDGSQGVWSFIRFGDEKPRHNALAVRALDRALDTWKIGRFSYSNENYAVLGTIIEAVAQQPYQEACASRVFTPAGVTATPSPQTMPFLAWGGWMMSVADYGKFHRFYFGPESAIGRDPLAYPYVRLMMIGHYGMGMFFQGWEDAEDTDRHDMFKLPKGSWHFGSHCFPLRLNAGAYVEAQQGEYSYVAAYDECLNEEQFQKFATAMTFAYPQ